MKNNAKLFSIVFAGASMLAGPSAYAVCEGVPSYDDVTNALKATVADNNGGLGFNMWVSIVDRSGIVCRVTRSGNPGEQWPGSRVISAQKANTANAFSLPGFALSTANLYAPVQPGGSLFGLQESNPVNDRVAYRGPSAKWGTKNDPMVGNIVGGVNVFGGGLALYAADGTLVGGLGASGDTSCADHNIAWKVRHALNLDNVPAGVSTGGTTDNIQYGTGGFTQVACNVPTAGTAEAESATLPTDFPVGPAP